MLAIFAVIIGGIVTGRLLVGWRLAFVQRLITFIIWALLFLLGVEVGSDPAVVGSLATLGAAAFAIFALSVAGSVFAAWLLWRRIRGRAVSADEGGDADEAPVSAWTALKGSLVIVAFFVAGCVAGLFAPFDMTGSRMSAYVLYALMFCVGVTLGNDRTLAERVRRLDPRLALLPVATAVGTLAGAALAAPLLGGWSLTDSLAVGAGFGYYSLSSIFIADLRGPELATIALLCNVMREIFTLLAAPLVARWCGPLAAVSIGGDDDLRHHAARHHAGRRAALCRGFDLPRLCARFQRPVSGDVFLYDLICTSVRDIGTFWWQKYHKSGKKANVSTGIDNQVVFLSSSLYKGFRICNWRHRRTKVRFPNHYLVPECLLFPKTVIYRLLHFRSS